MDNPSLLPPNLHEAIIYFKDPERHKKFIHSYNSKIHVENPISTPLHTLVQMVNKFPEILNLVRDNLKYYSQHINAQDKNKWTPLHYAAALSFNNSWLEMLELLLSMTPPPALFLQDNEGFTALHILAYSITNENSIKALTALLVAGSNTNAQSKRGKTPLHLLLSTIRPQDNCVDAPNCDCNDSNIFRAKIMGICMLIDNETNLYLKDEDGNTVLHLLSRRCSTRDIRNIIIFFIDNNVDFSCMNNQRITADSYFDYELNHKMTIKMFERLHFQDSTKITVIISKL